MSGKGKVSRGVVNLYWSNGFFMRSNGIVFGDFLKFFAEIEVQINVIEQRRPQPRGIGCRLSEAFEVRFGLFVAFSLRFEGFPIK